MYEYDKDIVKILLYGNDEFDALYGDGSQKCMVALKKRECEMVDEIVDPITLHIFVSNYNFDDGFEIPTSVIKNKNCCLSTALHLFYLVDGLGLLSNKNEFLEMENEYNKDWIQFLLKLEKMILDEAFNDFKIEFSPPLSRVERYYLEKANPNLPKIFLSEIYGVHLEGVSL